MATWPANGDTDWNAKMLAYLAIGHNTDGTHNQEDWTPSTQTGADDSNGEITFPNGFQVKWGKTAAFSENETRAIDFTDAGLTDFDNACFQGFATYIDTNNTESVSVTTFGTTSITINAGTVSPSGIRWFAIGR